MTKEIKNATEVKTVASEATVGNTVTNAYTIVKIPTNTVADIVYMTEDEFRKTFPGEKIANGICYKHQDKYYYVCLCFDIDCELASFRFLAKSIWQQVERFVCSYKPYKGRKYDASLVAEALFFYNLLCGYEAEDNYKMIVEQMRVSFPKVKDAETAKSLVQKSRSEFANKSFSILGEDISKTEFLRILTMTGRISYVVHYFLLSWISPEKNPLDIVCEIDKSNKEDPELALECIRILLH